eukprot:snap_masked-scaffold_43-processed-gene-1.53-mRNA-1 protein AED:0.12 eAED:0.13 QI:0/-1/0/1/-1/1/1/0/242
MNTAALRTFLSSTILTLMTEVGDKTFFVTALLAAKHPPKQVYFSCYSALAVMTAFSGLLASLLPVFANGKGIKLLAIVLLLFFGWSPVIEKSTFFSKEEEETDEEEEAKQEVEKVGTNNLEDKAKILKGVFEACLLKLNLNFRSSEIDTLWKNLVLSFEMFSLVFLAEWGDKSQMTTMTLSSTEIGAIPVILGGLIGHAICSGLAVIFGTQIITKLGLDEDLMELFAAALFTLFSVQIGLNL